MAQAGQQGLGSRRARPTGGPGGLLVLRRWSKIYFVLWWLVSSVIWVNLFLALILEVSATLPGLFSVGVANLLMGAHPELGPKRPCWVRAALVDSGSVLPWGCSPWLLGASWNAPDL